MDAASSAASPLKSHAALDAASMQLQVYVLILVSSTRMTGEKISSLFSFHSSLLLDLLLLVTLTTNPPLFLTFNKKLQRTMKKILVPTDFSDHASYAFETAVSIAPVSYTHLTLPTN